MSILGIDLGTTNSLACVWKGKEAILIPNAFGSYLTPSVVSFLENGEVLVGEGAKQRLHTHPSLTFAEFKRCMGTDTVYTVHGKTYYPQDLSAMVIRKLVENASVFLNERIEEAIISVPAYFNDDQRWATKIAGQLAGIRVERIINEPSAAALSQHIQQTEEDMLALVVDFGGGTLDISIVEAFDNIVDALAAVDPALGLVDVRGRNDFFHQNASQQVSGPVKTERNVLLCRVRILYPTWGIFSTTIGTRRFLEHEQSHHRHRRWLRQRQDHSGLSAQGPFRGGRSAPHLPRQLLQAPRRAAL